MCTAPTPHPPAQPSPPTPDLPAGRLEDDLKGGAARLAERGLELAHAGNGALLARSAQAQGPAAEPQRGRRPLREHHPHLRGRQGRLIKDPLDSLSVGPPHLNG